MHTIINIVYEDDIAQLYLDNGEVIEIPLLLYYDLQLKVNQPLDLSLYHRLLEVRKEEKMKHYVHRTLTKKDASSHELIHYLETKFGASKEQVSRILLPYIQAGVINDERYLKDKIEDLLRKQQGRERIRRFLEEKGFDEAQFDEVWNENHALIELQQARLVVIKYQKQKASKPEGKWLRGLFQRLHYCGYNEAILYQVLREIGVQLDDFTSI